MSARRHLIDPTPAVCPESRPLFHLGRALFGLGILGFGAQQVWTEQFSRMAPPPSWWTPQPFWARLVGAILLVAGIAILAGRRVRLPARVVSTILALALVLLLFRTAGRPLAGFMWIAPFKMATMLCGALLLAGAFDARDRSVPKRHSVLAPPILWSAVVLGAFLFFCGTQHYVYASFTADMVPGWIPGHVFWAYFTGTALLAGGLGIFVPRTAQWAAILSGTMILSFAILMHIPASIRDPKQSAQVAAAWEAFAITGVAFLVADRIGRRPEGRRPDDTDA